MKKVVKVRFLIFASIAGAIGIGVLVGTLINRRKKSLPDRTAVPVIAGSGGGGGGSAPGIVYNPFSIKKAFLNSGNYVPYANLEDSLDKNLDGSGFVNESGTLYTTSMDSGNRAFSDINGLTIFPAGYYFYEETFEMLLIDAQGRMTFYHDVDKTNLNSQQITESFT